MKRTDLIFLALTTYFALMPALLIGALVSVFDSDLGLITFGVAFGWQFIELISRRKSKWWV